MNKINIVCSSDNKEERVYVFKVLLEELLGVDYSVSFCENHSTYDLLFEDKNLCFNDNFFALNKSPFSYCTKDNIPEDVIRMRYSVYPEEVIGIYGTTDFIENTNKIYCGIDIFASAFFMLTRWEEYVIEKKNNLGRVDEFELLALKHGFFRNPVVNEYAELLRAFLNKLGYKIKFSKERFKIKLTHDVDWVYLSTQKELFFNLKKRIVIKDQFLKSLKIFFNYYHYKIRGINPFDPFDEIMDIADQYNLDVAFYFKASELGEQGFTYNISDERAFNMVQKIETRGYEVGFHPSENTVSNDVQFNEEASRLNCFLKEPMQGGRNHGLFYNNKTFLQWERIGFKYDSGMGFQFTNGFRCGICDNFPVFDIFTRRQLALRELPFVAMDTVVIRQKTTPNNMYRDVIGLINIVKKYGGNVALNWHTNLVNSIDLKKYKASYFAILKYIGKYGT